LVEAKTSSTISNGTIWINSPSVPARAGPEPQ
jgi:hypothetical protein